MSPPHPRHVWSETLFENTEGRGFCVTLSGEPLLRQTRLFLFTCLLSAPRLCVGIHIPN